MNKTGRSQLALGVILILIGGWFLLNQTMPGFREFFEPYTEWPANMLLIGAGILIIGLVTGSPGLAVPAAIVAGIGGIFYYQEAVGDYESWSYMWALIPGFIGGGGCPSGIARRKHRPQPQARTQPHGGQRGVVPGLRGFPRRLEHPRQLWSRRFVDSARSVGAWQRVVSNVSK